MPRPDETLKQVMEVAGAAWGDPVELSDVKGVGPSAAKKLRQAGVTTVDALAELDLRKQAVEGLSSENLATLRENAQRFLKAQEANDLTLVEGLGPSAKRKLKAAGIETIADLAHLDLRKTDVDGLSTEHIQKLKRNARYLVK